MRRPQIPERLLAWERRIILRCEDWVFESPFEAEQIRTAIADHVDRKERKSWTTALARVLPLPKWPGNRHVLGILEGHNLVLWARPSYDVFLLFPERYVGCFVGHIEASHDGSVICGRYGPVDHFAAIDARFDAGKDVILGIVNLVQALWSLVIIFAFVGSLYELFAEGSSDPALALLPVAFLLFLPLPLLGFRCFFTFYAWIDGSSRRTTRLFLEWISHYSGIASET